MPQIETWSRIPTALRQHLVERMRDRNISLQDLNRLRLWMETKPEVRDLDNCDWNRHFRDLL